MNEAIVKTINKTLDVSGLLCPEPIMMLHKTIREVDAGEVIEMIATDPSTTRDVPKFCMFLGHELIEQKQDASRYYYYIRKQ